MQVLMSGIWEQIVQLYYVKLGIIILKVNTIIAMCFMLMCVLSQMWNLTIISAIVANYEVLIIVKFVKEEEFVTRESKCSFSWAMFILCSFFRQLCGKSLNPIELDKLQERIILILCHIKMLYIPSFFIVIIHWPFI